MRDIKITLDSVLKKLYDLNLTFVVKLTNPHLNFPGIRGLGTV